MHASWREGRGSGVTARDLTAEDVNQGDGLPHVSCLNAQLAASVSADERRTVTE